MHRIARALGTVHGESVVFTQKNGCKEIINYEEARDEDVKTIQLVGGDMVDDFSRLPSEIVDIHRWRKNAFHPGKETLGVPRFLNAPFVVTDQRFDKHND